MARRATGYSDRGKGNTDRPSRKEYNPSNPFQRSKAVSNITAMIADDAKYNEFAEVEEKGKDFSIPGTKCQPRQSLTNRLFLRILPTKVETEAVKAMQLLHDEDGNSTGELVATTSPRVTWRSDKTLLNTKRQDSPLDFKRQTHYTKRILSDRARPIDDRFDPLVQLVRLIKRDNRIVVIALSPDIHPKYGIILK